MFDSHSTSVRTSVSTTQNNNQTTIIEAPKAEFAGKEFFFWKVTIKGTYDFVCDCRNEYCKTNHQDHKDINRIIAVKTATAQDAVNRVRTEIIAKEYVNDSTRNPYRTMPESSRTYDIKVESCVKMPDEEWL